MLLFSRLSRCLTHSNTVRNISARSLQQRRVEFGLRRWPTLETTPTMSEASSAEPSQVKAQGKGQQGEGKQGKGQQGSGKGKGKMRGLPSDSPEIRLSKTITWVLRHAAKQEGLALRKDGYARVEDLLQLPKLQGLDFMTLEKLVHDDQKGRFNLLYESDNEQNGDTPPVWWIRANQGHTIKTVDIDAKPIKSLADIPSGIAVHGTSVGAWGKIKHEGLSRMERNHIHLAQGLPGTGVLSGMRRRTAVFIYIDIEKALAAGLKFYLSSNGVVLSEGDAHGFIHPQFFQKVENAKRASLLGRRCSRSPTIDSLPAETPLGNDETVVEEINEVEGLSL